MTIRKKLIKYIGQENLALRGLKLRDIFNLLLEMGAIPKKHAKANREERFSLMTKLVGSSPKKKRATKSKAQNAYAKASNKFFASRAWKELRYKIFARHGRKCMLCGNHPPFCILHIDHIKPRLKYPQLEMDEDNLQVLCADCNAGKSYKHIDDFREIQELEDQFNRNIEKE